MPQRDRLSHRLLLLGRFHDAEDDHDQSRREACDGVTAAALCEDKARWEDLGRAIADLALLAGRKCRASPYCNARPEAGVLAARLAEAMDGELDAPAWRIMNAAARLAAAKSR